MGKESITFKGYTITARPRRLAESKNWTVDLLISRGAGDEQETWLISAGDQTRIDDDALEYCFNFGKEIIEREMA